MSEKIREKTDAEIDEIVVAQADDETAWDEPIQVHRSSSEIGHPRIARENPMHEYVLREARRQRQILHDLGLDNRRLNELAAQQRLMDSLRLDYWKTDFARIAAESIASLINVGNSPFFEATNEANRALVQLLKTYQEEQYPAKHFALLSQAWHKELHWIRDIESLAINKAITEHLAQVTEISVLAQSAISHLSQEHIAGAFILSLEERAGISASVAGLASSYRDLFASFERESFRVLSLPPVLSRLPAVEFFNAADLMHITSTQSIPAGTGDDEEKLIVREEIYRDTSDTLEELLTNFDPELVGLRKGARQALVSKNPDKVRHFVISYRELFTQVLHRLAPDQEIRGWSTAPEHYSRSGPTRRARLLYISRNLNQPSFTSFLEKDIESLLAAVQLFQKGTHAASSDYSPEQLKALEIRIEAALRFMLEVSKSDHETK